ncbi:MAG TPA: 4-hydroxy-tetrahydrodipicolinate reductase [Phycisphaerae bacterium]|nr:4-hydroxy-tetrahydrodipicolinate reductase [Phycisphaerae bacterium]
MIRLAVAGATGQTGSRVVQWAARHPEFKLVAALAAESDPRMGQPAVPDDPTVLLADDTDAAYDVLIDFSTPAGTVQWCGRTFQAGAAFVSGTTGLSDEQQLVLHVAAEKVPVLWAANFSVGINLLLRTVGPVARELGADFDVEIVEAHHTRKVDAPSGTALALGKTIAEATGRSLEADAIHGRSGSVGPRPKGQIGFHALRLGDEVGRHEIHFGGPGETLVLQHTVRSRDTFARGALVAAHWLVRQKPALYSMQDMLAAAK